MISPRDSGSADMPGGFLRQLLTRLDEESRPSAYYGGSSLETYVFAFEPEGYENPFRVILEIPRKSIDEEAGPTRRDPAEQAFLRESGAFDRLLPNLLQTRAGLFVAVSHGQVIDEDADEFALARRIEQTHRSEFVLIRRVCTDVIEHHFESPEVEKI